MFVKPLGELRKEPKNKDVGDHVTHDGSCKNKPSGELGVFCQEDGNGGAKFGDGEHGPEGDSGEDFDAHVGGTTKCSWIDHRLK